MGAETILFYTAAGIVFVFSVIEGVSLAIKCGKVGSTTGTIVEIKRALEKSMHFANSKWAAFSYHVDGQYYVSENRAAVPMTAEVGDQRRIRYLRRKPQELYSRSVVRLIILLSAAVACALIGWLLR